MPWLTSSAQRRTRCTRRGICSLVIRSVGPAIDSAAMQLPSCPNTVHIGASGLIFGWLTFLIVFGWWVRKPWQIVVGVLVALLYGSLLLGVVPDLNTCGGISWQGHLCGAIAGVVAAYLLSGPERTARAQKRPVQQ